MGSEALGVPLFTNLDDADPVVIESVNEARRTLPQFLDAVMRRRFSPATYLVKVPFIDRSATGEQAKLYRAEDANQYSGGSICHLWLGVRSVLENLLFCWVGEAPDEWKLERDVAYLIESERIEDWMINHDGIGYGGFSLRIVRSRIGQEKRAKFDAHIGIREFKTLVAQTDR